MGVIGFLVWYILPFTLVMVILPKYVAASSGFIANYSKPVLLRHVLFSLVFAVIPLINAIAVLIIIGLYMFDYEKFCKFSFLDIKLVDLFKRKSK